MIITIPGRPVTKKNSQQLVYKAGRSFIIQSKAWREYERFCIGTKTRPGWLAQWGNIYFDTEMEVCARYWLPNKAHFPDLVGLLQGTGDILEKAGIILNDRLIVSWDGSRIMGVDKDNPRTEIEIKGL